MSFVEVPFFQTPKTLCLSSAESSEVSSQQRIASLGCPECISERFLKARHPWILGNKRNCGQTFAVNFQQWKPRGGLTGRKTSIFSSVILLKIGFQTRSFGCQNRWSRWMLHPNKTVKDCDDGSLAVVIDSSCNRRYWNESELQSK